LVGASYVAYGSPYVSCWDLVVVHRFPECGVVVLVEGGEPCGESALFAGYGWDVVE
jgi:hypothetical protein